MTEGRPEVVDVSPHEVTLVDRNARYMTPEQFGRLVANMRRDGFCSQPPYLWADPDQPYEEPVVLSGNHRIRAAREAELDTVTCLLDRRPLTEQQRVAIQLSHNAIAGQDDPAILADLYADLDSIDLRDYAGLDDDQLALLDKVNVPTLAEHDLDRTAVTFLMLPDDADRLRDALTELSTSAADDCYAARYADVTRFMTALDEVRGAADIADRALALACLLDTHEANLADLSSLAHPDPDEHGRWVPLSSVFGTRNIPPDLAAAIRRVIDDAVSAGDIPHGQRWRALETFTAR